MAELVHCPECGKGFTGRDEWTGKRVRCPGCQAVFRFGTASPGSTRAAGAPPKPRRDVMAELLDEEPPGRGQAESLGPESEAPPGRPGKREAGRARRPAGPARGLSDSERAWLRSGAGIVVFGVVSLILPMFGLQFRKLGRLGEGSWKAGVGLIVVGVLIMAGVFLRRYLLLGLKVAVGAVVGAVVGMFALLTLVGIMLRGHRPQPPPLPPPGVSPFVMPHPAGPPRADFPGTPFPGRPPGPPGGGPAGHFERISARFGRDRIVRLKITGTAGLNVGPTLTRELDEIRDPGPGKEWQFSPEGDQVDVVLAPVGDLDACAARIDFGTVAEIDRDGRLITVVADPGRFTSP